MILQNNIFFIFVAVAITILYAILYKTYFLKKESAIFFVTYLIVTFVSILIAYSIIKVTF